MNIFILLIVVLGASAELNEQFQKFKRDFGKTYSNKVEEEYRKGIFAQSLQRITAHNIKYTNGESTHFAGLSHMSDMLPGELGPCFIQQNLTTNAEMYQYDPLEELPSEIDWRQKGAVTPVKYQGPVCGSCWSFGTTGSLEGVWAAKHGELVSLSEQNLLDCCNHDDYICFGCNGGYPKSVFGFIKTQKGIDSEEQYPYTAKEGKCTFKKPDSNVKVHGVKSIPYKDEDALKSAVANIGPIVIGINGGSEIFQDYKGGILDNPKCDEHLDHAVVIVGYGTDKKTGVDYWLVKNSWGTTWGEEGYIRLVRNKNMCGIGSDACYPVV